MKRMLLFQLSLCCEFCKRHLVSLHKGGGGGDTQEKPVIRAVCEHLILAQKDAKGREGGIVKKVCPTFFEFLLLKMMQRESTG